jgi:hypothetical protein
MEIQKRHRVRRSGIKVVQVAVEMRVYTGMPTQQQLSAWVQEAVDKYHSFRAGHVGVDAAATVKPPKVVGVEVLESS